MVARHGSMLLAIDLWAVLPGGRPDPAILVQQRPSPATQALAAFPTGCCRDFGNMSSPTILHLETGWRCRPQNPLALCPPHGVPWGFGPGLSIEAAAVSTLCSKPMTSPPPLFPLVQVRTDTGRADGWIFSKSPIRRLNQWPLPTPPIKLRVRHNQSPGGTAPR